MLEHVVEREQAAHQHGRRGDPAVPDVLGTERAVESPLKTRQTRPIGGIPGGVFSAAVPLLDQPRGRGARPFVVRVQERVACAQMKTPLWRHASAIHSALRPVHPNGSSALSRPARWAITGCLGDERAVRLEVGDEEAHRW